MNNRIKALSSSTRLLLVCYTIVTLFSLALLFVSITFGEALVGIMLVIILAGITYPLVLFLESRMTRPIRHITEVAVNVTNGDFTSRVSINSKDSLGELGQALNQMIDRLTSILEDTNNLSNHVTETGQNIYHKNANLKEVLQQVSTSTNELATGANQISEDVSDISSSLKMIEDMLTSLVQSTQEMNSHSTMTIHLVEQGRNYMNSQSVGMQNNVEATKNVAHTINELAQSVSGISKITRTISEIADQTNLLSLNASIEAARAGEHGQGFAIVAQEVRNLAEESSRSAKEVFNLVQTIERGIKQAIENINKNESVVAGQHKLIQDTTSIFTAIVDSTKSIADQIQSFTEESRSMLESTQKIASTMENISAITQQSAAGTEQVSASMIEQISSAEEMLAQAEKMSEIVQDLRRTIEVLRFRKEESPEEEAV